MLKRSIYLKRLDINKTHYMLCILNFRAQNCKGYVARKGITTKGRQTQLCTPCTKLRSNMRKKKKLKNAERNKALRKKCKNVTRQHARLRSKVGNIHKQIHKQISMYFIMLLILTNFLL